MRRPRVLSLVYFSW